jgi:hypothetical protein
MALTKIRGNTQILDNSITENQISSTILATNSGLTGLGGSKLAVGAGTGLVVSGSTVGIATNSTVTFSGASWTFPAGELLITGTPSTSTSAVNKAYVDNFVYGLSPRGEVDAVADSNISSLSGTITIDGVPLNIGDRVLLTAQSNPIENGIWVIQSGAWVRPSDFANGQDVSSAYVYTSALGSSYANSEWICISPKGSATVGTDSLTFILFASAGARPYSAGTGISISSGVISLQTPVAVANGGTGVNTFGGTNTILYTPTANNLSAITTANNAVLVTDGSGVPSLGTTLPTQVQDNITRTGTLVSGATGSGFTISFAASSVSGTLSVANGGTGLSTIATNSLVYGNGTGALQLVTPAANSVLTTTAGSVPTLSTTLPTPVQDNITRTGTLVSGSTGTGFTIALGVSTVTGILQVGNGGTGVSTLVANQLIVGDGTNAVKTLFKAKVLVGANSSSVTITGLVAGATIYRVTRNGINETENLSDYSASAPDTLTNTTDPFMIGEQIYVEQIQ